ncbi:MAG: FAD-dependent oxidoreductase, partial [Moorella sp. (in: Bacteria)]|nr:FAD-dependent oxidoreductase [Moorella sp. (in: firmicutes)]
MPGKKGLFLFLGFIILVTALAGAGWRLWPGRAAAVERAGYYLTMWRAGQVGPRQTPDPASFPPASPPVDGASYDVLVVGGEPEGVAAAISAARQGAKVLLVDKHDGLGGLFTYGWLNFIDMNYGPKYDLLTRGTFLEFYRQVGGSIFDVAVAKKVFLAMVEGYP